MKTKHETAKYLAALAVSATPSYKSSWDPSLRPAKR